MAGTGTGQWRDESGALTAEYVAAVIVVGLVVAALFAAAIPTTIGEWGRYAVCSLFGDDCELPQPALTDEDVRPDCNIMSTSFEGEIGVDVLVFDVEGGVTVTRTDSSNGNTTFTLLETIGAGLSGEVGVEAAGGVASAEALAEARVGMTAHDLQAYVMSTSEADEFERLFHQRAAIEAGSSWMPFGGGLVEWVADRTVGDLGDPHKTFHAVDVNASADAKATVDLFGEQVAGAEIGIEGALLIGIEEDRTPNDVHTNAEIYQVDWGASAEVGFVAGEADASAAATSVMAVVRDLDGTLLRVEFENTYTADSGISFGSNLEDIQTMLTGGQDRSMTQRAVLELPEDTDRRVVEEWLDTGRNSEAVGQMTQQRGEISYLVYEGDEYGLALGGKVALGVKLGLMGSGSRATSTLVDAHYAGVPQADGTRRLVPNLECLTAAGG
ncbi:MAG TPA: hypothetical protein VK906_06615 [Egicoccus sp.]|nr:hypothetical protein [Egicoccus sp.]HSK22828.1 hypothetical protein [Egicoccus sp.]